MMVAVIALRRYALGHATTPSSTRHRRHALRRLRQHGRKCPAGSRRGRDGQRQFRRPHCHGGGRCRGGQADPGGDPGRLQRQRDRRPGKRRTRKRPRRRLALSSITAQILVRPGGRRPGAGRRLSRHAGIGQPSLDANGIALAGGADPGGHAGLRPAVFHRHVESPACRPRHHGHPDRARHGRCLGLFGAGHLRSRAVPGRHGRAVLGCDSGGHRPGRAGTGAGDACTRPGVGGGETPDRPQAENGARGTRRAGNRPAADGGRAERHPAGAAGRKDRGGWSGHRRPFQHRCLDADRRTDAGGNIRRQHGHRRHAQQVRRLSLPRHARRPRHGAGTHHRTGAAGARGKTGDRTAGGSRRRRIRAGRAGHRRRHFCRVVFHRPGTPSQLRHDRCSVGAGHRLPMCPRPGYPDGGDGRRRQGGGIRHPHSQRQRPAAGRAADLHRAGQDRHGDRRPAERDRRDRCRRPGTGQRAATGGES
ncbi:hypothetical protein GALL_379280 [mine drainage metagenome]|uniref:Uncharacterized protein n=1 Tax=mine drainage metagenome TaxID=410659 RepID=A0A1J5QAV4_9ZZZZ